MRQSKNVKPRPERCQENRKNIASRGPEAGGNSTLKEMKDDQQEGEKGNREVEGDIRAKSYKAWRAMDKGTGSPSNNTS